MAAASTSPPPMSTSQGIDSRKHMSMLGYSSPGSTGQAVPRKPLNPSSLEAGSARLRDGPVSPVRVNLHDEGLPEPSNADIEHAVPPRPAQLGAVAQTQSARAPLSHSQPPQTSTIEPVPSDIDELAAPVMSPKARVRHQEVDRNSRESDETASTSQQQVSGQSSAATSASSVSGTNDCSEYPSSGHSPGSSILEGHGPKNASVPQFQYHHQHQEYPPRRVSSGGAGHFARSPSSDVLENGGNIRRHLTPTSASRGRSPNLMPGGSHMRAPSVQSRNSPDVRLSTYAELLNVPYPQQAPAPLSLDNSNLRTVVGNNASLLSTQKTLDMYRQNVKKTTDFSIQYSFAVFLISTAQEQGLDLSNPKSTKKPTPQPLRDLESPVVEENASSPYDLVREARQILQRLANGGYPFAQYYLADGFASGLFSKGKEDYNSAFPLFVLAAKHGHAESAYRTALCYEFGWGCRKDPAKAVQFLRSAASKRHPGAMTRLGKACLSGDLGEKRYREGLKWLKLATEAADSQYNAAPYQLGCLYETGYGDDVFADEYYAAELFTQAADLGHPEANYRMGDAYEHGRLNCPRDPALSVHFYTGAAERGHSAAMMGLCAWYMVGAPPILEKDEEEAYEWARRSAELGFVKAQYAVGYFTEMGIGCRRDILEANVWYVKAADAGDERAKQRIAVIQAAVSGQGTPMDVAAPRGKKGDKDDKDDKECVVM
ncbi:hypothetical protein C2857_001566 [Epichloe festucae Fl1]|uniref:Protoplast regeneration and killer toxin resistance protein n=1 Tax=Epichloe festucae (strain Fl1) TaxID=877507 RepID=A0A7S9KRK8_EPIFF|nr:hypothetical protein C2857_001566 [Epichloe festucae Fl1]